MPKPTPEDVLKAIEEPDPEEEMERVLAMTPEQRRAELEAAGVDIAELHAKADALHERLVQGAAAVPEAAVAAPATATKPATTTGTAEPVRTRSLPPKPVRRSYVSLAAAAAVVAVAGGVAYTMATQPPVPLAPERQTASELRQRAFDACSREQWKECLAGLDEAKKLDPAGDEGAAVQAARRRAQQGAGAGTLPR
jgi:hypothetical protein